MNAVVFRNVEASADDPVETWPFEAVVAALERGDLPQWRRLVEAVRERPWGRVARYVEQAVEVARPFGTGPLMREVVVRARAAAEASERAQVAAQVRDLVARSGRTQAQLAADVGTSASRMSTYATGAVTPSAAMMVRIRRAAAQAPGRTSPAS